MAELSRQEFGAGAGGTPLVIAHGLFGAGRNWRAIARALSAARHVVTVDMRNHGGSFHHPDHRYRDLAEDLAATIAGLGGRADLMGHSMGGKAAMLLALTRPAMLRRLVVADIAPVAYRHSHAPLIAALRRLDLAGLADRAEADRRLARDIPDRALRAFLLQSLIIDAGGARWALNLEALERAMPELTGWPRVDGRFDGPTLFLAGGESDYLRPEHHNRIRALFPAARIEVIPGAGHWLHAERPGEVIAAVDRFLSA